MTEVHLEHVLRVLGRHVTRAAAEALAPLRLMPIEYDMMETIARYMEDPDSEHLTISTIATRVGVLYATGANHVNRLERMGYVRYTANGSRLLTTKGIDALEEARHALRTANRTMQRYFNDYGLEDLANAFLKQQEGER